MRRIGSSGPSGTGSRSRAARMGGAGHNRRGSTQPEVGCGTDRIRAAWVWVSLDNVRQTSSAAVGRRTRAPERTCLVLLRTPSENTGRSGAIGGAEVAPAGDKAVHSGRRWIGVTHACVVVCAVQTLANLAAKTI